MELRDPEFAEDYEAYIATSIVENNIPPERQVRINQMRQKELIRLKR
jgi:hypothetical protein